MHVSKLAWAGFMMSVLLKETLKYALRSKPLISREIRHIEWLYSLSDDELYEYKEKQFLHVFRKAYRKSPFYRELYDKHGVSESDIRSLDDIVKLPVLTKDMLRQNGRAMLTVPQWMVKKADTSGTTGSPLTAYHSYKAIRLEQAYNWCRRKKCGYVYGKNKLVSLRGNLGVDTFRVYVPVSRTLYLSSYQIADESAGRYVDAILKFNPESIEGYPSSLFNLALAIDRYGCRLSIPRAFTSSETLFPFQRDLIERVFKTDIYDQYGCTERSVSFSERVDHQGYYEDPGYCHTEFFGDHLVTTSLINASFPLIRYRVDDVLRRGANGSVEAVEGRNEDVVVCKDGVNIGRLDHILKGVAGVSVAQIIQTVKGEIEIRYVPDATFTDNSVVQIEDRLYRKIRKDNIDVRFIKIDNDGIIYGARNKFSFVKSYLDSQP